MVLTTTPPKRPRRPRHRMQTIFAQVARTARITPHMARITFRSPEFAGFITPFPDQFVTALFPLPGQTRPVIVPGFTWTEYFAMPEDVRPVARNYTVRRYRSERAEIDIDFVLHGDIGFGTRWAARAQPGDQVGFWGPRVAYNPAPSVEWQLLIGDETGLPAIGAILEALPPGARATVIVEVASAAGEQFLPSAGDVAITWLHRDDTPAGASRQLLGAVERVTFPDGPVYAWGGGEMELMTAFGKHLRRDRGLKTAAISAVGYWRRDQT